MIRKTLIICCILAPSTQLMAQTDVVLARANYVFVQDTLHTGKTRPENMVLFLGKNASLYTSFDKIKHELGKDQKRVAQAMQASGNGAPKLIKLDNSESDWMSKTALIIFRNENKLFTKENVAFQTYLIEEKIPTITWKITKDTMSLSGVHCNQAIADFEGRKWTVWFATDLPFQSGPWKLTGLPGLILSAVDEKKEIEFKFSGFEKAIPGEFKRTTDIRKSASYQAGDLSMIDVMVGTDVASAYFENTIILPKYRTVKTSRIELEKLKHAYQKDPQGFIKTQFGH